MKALTSAQEERIIDSIQQAEAQTTGEIRVHLSQKEDEDSFEKTKAIFHELRMYNTQDRNAVLVHLSLTSRSFSIYADHGIYTQVSPSTWSDITGEMKAHFVAGDLTQGICLGVKEVGKLLRAHYPTQNKKENALADEITYD